MPVLVTGSHRSGTTWLGRMLAGSPEFLYVHEPFNPAWPSPYFLGRSSHWFEYVRQGEPTGVATATRKLCEFELEVGARFRRIRGLRGQDGLKWQLVHLLRFWWAKARSKRLLMKDPFALFCAPWLHAEFGFRPIVTIRHPAAFVGALKRADWRFDFRNFSERPHLMQDLLANWSDEIEAAARRPPSLVPMACLLWNILHDVIARQRTEHPDWCFVRHEDLARDPMGGFRRVFDWLGLPMRDSVRALIVEHSRPFRRPHGEEPLLSVKRDSRAQIFNWKERLTPEEIDHVRRATECVATRFYQDSDWGALE